MTIRIYTRRHMTSLIVILELMRRWKALRRRWMKIHSSSSLPRQKMLRMPTFSSKVASPVIKCDVQVINQLDLMAYLKSDLPNVWYIVRWCHAVVRRVCHGWMDFNECWHLSPKFSFIQVVSAAGQSVFLKVTIHRHDVEETEKHCHHNVTGSSVIV